MSVSSILAFVLAGVAAKAKSVQVAKPSEDRIAELEAERDRQYEANAHFIARIAELEGDVHRANIQYRRDQELIDIWRERALANVPAGPDFRPPQIALQQAALQMQAQAQAQHNQLAQYQGFQNAPYNNQAALGAQMLGVQSLIDAELWCNCVPSRSQVWAADRQD